MGGKKSVVNQIPASVFAGLASHAMPFFRRHIGELKQFFFEHLLSSADPISTLSLLKMFLRERKMPFDMRQYMLAQREFICSKLGDESLSPEERQAAVSAWIKRYAEELRDQAIERQCLFLDEAAEWIVPEVESLLQENYK